MFESLVSTQDVSLTVSAPWRIVNLIEAIVVPSKMNPVGEAGNMFSSLFDRVPARRAGNEEDIAGTVIYLASRAGVR
jgi:hypothetical protein